MIAQKNGRSDAISIRMYLALEVLAVLKFYRIQLIHLASNSVLFLTIFVHLCEAYLGIMPSLVLLRYFFVTKKTLQNKFQAVWSCSL